MTIEPVSQSPLFEENLKNFQASYQKARSLQETIIVGQKNLLDKMWIVLLSGGHLLIEGVPGLAKTLAARSFAALIACPFKRIQFTPDLLPADLIGTSYYNPKEGVFSTRKGPIFTQVLLADEINRAPPKVQSALLEVMQERQATIFGTTYTVNRPFLVIATQNPIEQEGTYPLPEAEVDRFMMKVKIDYPAHNEEKTILERYASSEKSTSREACLTKEDVLQAQSLVEKVFIDEKVRDYLLHLVFATRQPAKYQIPLQNWVATGASPRASLALQIGGKARALLLGRSYVTPSDIKAIAPDILRHRIRLTFEAEAEGIDQDYIIEKILASLPSP